MHRSPPTILASRSATTAAVAIGLAMSRPTAAQWTVTNLHPPEAAESFSYGGAGEQQSGTVLLSGAYRASLWSGTAGTWVDLTPAGASDALAFGSVAGQQVGRAFVQDSEHAGLWSGSPASWVDLHPGATAISSAAFGTSGSHQVGYIVTEDGYDHASLWSGTAASWIDLNPTGAQFSRAFGVSGTQQVGNANVGVSMHASLWTGTAASWVDLHPAAASFSFAYGASGTQQVGYAEIGGADHASLWIGTAASWIDLNPAGASFSYAWNVGEGFQVGHALVGAHDHASLWSGTAASWVDLHTFVPGQYSGSYAESIWSNAGFMYIAGYGFNEPLERWEALLWMQPINSGACCNRWTGHCTVSQESICQSLGMRFDGIGTTCSSVSCQPCAADFNGSGGLSVHDIFDFLAAYFAGCP